MKTPLVAGALAFACIAITSPSARAQSAQEKAVADTFFSEGLKLLRAGKFAEACPKLAESERIDPAVGTALYLGECYERIAKIASAQAMFQEAFDFAKRRGDARASIAKEHHDKLVPSTLTLALAPDARVDGLQIKRDDIAVSLVEIGVTLPLDGGTHTLEVSAPGKKTFTTRIEIPAKDGAIAFTIPKLDESLTIRNTTSDANASLQLTQPKRTQRTIGLVVAGAGVATIVVGTLAGAIAMLDWNASNSTDNGCDSQTTACPTQHGVDLRSAAQDWATVSTVTLIAGGVLTAVGAIFFFTAPKASSRNASAIVVPTVFPHGVGAALSGAF